MYIPVLYQKNSLTIYSLLVITVITKISLFPLVLLCVYKNWIHFFTDKYILSSYWKQHGSKTYANLGLITKYNFINLSCERKYIIFSRKDLNSNKLYNLVNLPVIAILKFSL